MCNFFNIKIIKQNNLECATTALIQVLDYYNVVVNQQEVIDYCGYHLKYRDWLYLLGSYALEKGFSSVKVFTRSLLVFDATWFKLDKFLLLSKLEHKKKYINSIETKKIIKDKIISEIEAIEKFLILGGSINFTPIYAKLIEKYIDNSIPVIAMFTLQLAFAMSKEYEDNNDDMKGYPWRHCVVINGYDSNFFYITDNTNIIGSYKYTLSKELLIDSIIRQDNILLIIEK